MQADYGWLRDDHRRTPATHRRQPVAILDDGNLRRRGNAALIDLFDSGSGFDPVYGHEILRL